MISSQMMSFIDSDRCIAACGMQLDPVNDTDKRIVNMAAIVGGGYSIECIRYDVDTETMTQQTITRLSLSDEAIDAIIDLRAELKLRIAESKGE